MLSDNTKTFKSVSISITNTLRYPEVKKFFSSILVVWQFNLEKAPWQGGVFKHMMKSAKWCLRKAIGKNCLTFDKLLTQVIEVEGVLNSRPFTYVYNGNVTESWAPSYLLIGHWILTLPDSSMPIETDDDYTPKNLTRRAAHLVNTLQKFWKRWKQEYLLEIREFQCTDRQRGVTHVLQPGEVVSVYDENHPRGLRRIGWIEELTPSSDGRVRSVRVKVESKRGQARLIHRPIQQLYPLEVYSKPSNSTSTETTQTIENNHSPTSEDAGPVRLQPTRTAAVHARDRIVGIITDDD